MDTNPTFEKLKARLATVADLAGAAAILGWDRQVMMPLAGAPVRGEQLATLSRIAHQTFVSPETGKLLDELQSYEDSLDPESDEASLIRVTRRDFEKQVRVPAELRAESMRAANDGYVVWLEAKPKSDYKLFRPALERNLDLRHQYVECFDTTEEPYDLLLDDFERGMKTAEVREIFARLKDEQRRLIDAARERDDGDLDDVLAQRFSPETQREVCHEIVNLFGFRPDTWRLDITEHPFATNGWIDDIRITTKYHDDNLDAVFSTMHEYGHGIYEHQVDRALVRTPLSRGASLGLHESQSRMWENLVGRGMPFWRFFYGRLQRAFPQQLGSVDLDAFYRAINRVRPSLIRIESDEVTYNMHIILRFELEQELLHGRVSLDDLPDAWNQRMWEYLGVDVPDDRHGVLQDVHWSSGSMGYFPTYALGNVISVQIWEKIREDIPDLDEQFERGEFTSLREWLGDRLHRHGRKFTPQETVQKVTGSPIDPEPYLRYLNEKHGAAAPA
ncbi:MAG: carboxypeptidase M32 [Thermoleophilia bacterium]|nr:carboxypeptidase M32 [Thermoleophilia bacterium]